jgi:serine O-acetyltransferase
VIYRFGRWLEKLSKHHYGWTISFLLYPAYNLLSVFMQKAYGINLDQSADIAPGFCITHFGGIEVINCCIGLRCNIHQQVKLGTAETTNKGLVIGDGVYIGAHTQIHSNIRIGDGVTIGAGTVVTQSIPPHCLVLGNPGRIVQRDYDNSSLL